MQPSASQLGNSWDQGGGGQGMLLSFPGHPTIEGDPAPKQGEGLVRDPSQPLTISLFKARIRLEPTSLLGLTLAGLPAPTHQLSSPDRPWLLPCAGMLPPRPLSGAG